MNIKRVLAFQAAYYFVTGMWPVIHINSFLAISGDKTDLWLVKMVGLLTTAIAISLAYCAARNTEAGRVLGIPAATAYTIVDVYYYMAHVIPAIYLVDAAIEIILISALLLLGRKT